MHAYLENCWTRFTARARAFQTALDAKCDQVATIQRNAGPVTQQAVQRLRPVMQSGRQVLSDAYRSIQGKANLADQLPPASGWYLLPSEAMPHRLQNVCVGFGRKSTESFLNSFVVSGPFVYPKVVRTQVDNENRIIRLGVDFGTVGVATESVRDIFVPELDNLTGRWQIHVYDGTAPTKGSLVMFYAECRAKPPLDPGFLDTLDVEPK